MKQLLIVGGIFVLVVGSYFMVFGNTNGGNPKGRYSDGGSYANDSTSVSGGRTPNTWTKAS